MLTEQLVVYGSDWCGDCRRARRFLDNHQIEYKWINIEQDKDGEDFVLKTNRGMRSIPTMVFPDGSVVVEPSSTQLAEKFAVLASS